MSTFTISRPTAIPHYVVLGFFFSGGVSIATGATAPEVAQQVKPVWQAGRSIKEAA
jgi:hypothetical protein